MLRYRIKQLDYGGGKIKKLLHEVKEGSDYVTFSDDGKLLAIGDIFELTVFAVTEKIQRLYNKKLSGDYVLSTDGHDIESANFSPDGKTIVSTHGLHPKVYDAITGKLQYTLTQKSDDNRQVVFLSNDRFLLANDTISHWQIQKDDVKCVFTAQP